MTIAITILIGLAVLSVLVLAHEMGHFITARTSGVKVEEFGIGLPPRLLSVKRGETRYSLNAIPFGGFNKLAGEEDPKVPRSLASKGIGIRLLVIGAGSLMNFLLALLLFSIVFMIPRDVVIGQVVVEDVALDSPAAMAGIKLGDIILSVNEEPVNNNSELYRYVQLNLGKEITVLVQHSDLTKENVQVIPRLKPPEGQGAMGVVIRTSNPTVVSQYYPFWRAIPMGAAKFAGYIVSYKDGLVGIFTGKEQVLIVGPVGIAQLTGEVAKTGIHPLLEIAALFSLILGICNLFPLPALDGGRIVFILLEWVRRGKRVPPKIEGLVHAIGLTMLLIFAVVVTYQDIIRLIRGESFLP
ncbi:putative zinc metalloprotease [subsurface metagenome]